VAEARDGEVQELLLRDVSRAGHELSRAHLTDLPGRMPLRDLVRRRVHEEVATYNADPGPIYRGLVAPADAVRYSDGFRMRIPRPLDADRFVTAVEEAVAAGLVRFRVGDTETADLDAEVATAEHDEVTTVLERPIVARAP
jgi:hypothetical protein